MPTKTVSSIIPREILINIIMSSTFSSIFFYLPFRGMEIIKLGSGEKFPPDFFPHALFLGFFCSLFPQILTSKSIRDGKLIGTALPIKRMLLRSLIFALAFAAILGTSAFLISSSLEGQHLSFNTAWLIKVAFAILISVIITPLALRPLQKQPS